MKIKNENVGSIDPHVDEYINKLLDAAGGYELNSQSKKILNYVIYLLLNKKFQYVLQSFRLALYMPIDGLKNEEEQNLWKVKFREVVNKYHNGQEIDKGAKHLIEILELESKRPLTDIRFKNSNITRDVCDDAIVQTYNYIFRYLELTNTRNAVYWIGIIHELLLFNSPDKLVSYLSNRWKIFTSQRLTFEPRSHAVKMSFYLFPDTTIKDIEQLIESKRKTISEEINKIKGEARKNEFKTGDIKRDYLIYRTYINHKTTRQRGDQIYSNISKPDAVKKEIVTDSLDNKEARATKYLELESIRKIVDRMNKRIKNTFPNSHAELNAFLGLLSPKRQY